MVCTPFNNIIINSNPELTLFAWVKREGKSVLIQSFLSLKYIHNYLDQRVLCCEFIDSSHQRNTRHMAKFI